MKQRKGCSWDHATCTSSLNLIGLFLQRKREEIRVTYVNKIVNNFDLGNISQEKDIVGI